MAGKTLTDLNNILFDQIDRLNNTKLKGEELKEEIERADSVSRIATQIVQNANTVLKAAKFQDEKWSAEQDKATTMLLGE